MIQSYLKTGMVFYDDQNKQHFRNDCCKETFCQFTDKDHFPSYQIFTEGILQEPITRGDLIENGDFSDWSGVADPNNVPDGWAVVNNDATNYVHDAGGECQMISDNSQAVYIGQTPLTIGKWYVFTINVTAVVVGSIYLRNSAFVQTFATTGIHNVVFQAIGNQVRIVRTAACDVTFTDIRVEELTQIFDIYDVKDNYIGEWESNTPGTSFFSFAEGGSNITHDYRDDVIFPAFTDNETCYYIKLTINTETGPEYWYSEAFKICDCEIEETECRIVGGEGYQAIHDCNTNGSDIALIAGTTLSPIIYYYENKSYSVWKQREAVGYDSRAMIWAYNHETNTESVNYDLRSVGEVAGAVDYHPAPVVIVADDGHIVVAQEFPRIGVGNHNDAITIKRSDYPEDETSWVHAKAEDANYWTFIGSWQPDNSARLAYPNFLKDHAGNLYVVCRRYTASGRYLRVYKSTDHGVSWDDGHDIVDSENTDYWVYPVPIKTPTSDTLRFAVRYLNTGLGTLGGHKVYYIESSDGGVTWGDISGSHSQDTTVSPILLSTLDNAAYDYLVADADDYVYDLIWAESGTVDCGNATISPYIQTVEHDDPFVDGIFRMFWWDGDNWVNSVIKDNIDVLGRATLIHIQDYEFTCTVVYLDGADHNLALYRTYDLINWEKDRDIEESTGLTVDTFIATVFTFNYGTSKFWMGATRWGTNAAYSDIFFEVGKSRINELAYLFCDRITLVWWSDCDWDRIIYQDGYRNSLVLDSSLQTPTEDIVINPDERQGEMFVHDVIIKKRYKFNIRIPEYLWNALIRLPAYGSEMPNFHCWITLPDGSACPMSEVAILGEWDVGNCMNTFTIEFVDNDEYPVVATNCCDNEDISEI